MMRFAFPAAVLLLLLPVILRYVLPAAKGLYGDALRVPFIKDLQNINLKSGGIWGIRTYSNKITPALFVLYLVYVLLTAAVMRPQWVGEPVRVKNLSRDILLVMDISNSMLTDDFVIGKQRVNRLTAVKRVATEFIEKRPDDRMGLILFGTRAYLQAPVTYDKNSVKDILWQMDAGMAGDSTSIGDAVGLALKSLKDAPDPDKKIIILLTDGENNDGSIGMGQAIAMAKEEGVKVYTIGVGSDAAFMHSFMGFRLIPGTSGLDETSLKSLAAATKGHYFRAKDTQTLRKIYDIIDKLEPNENDARYITEVKELFYIPLAAALLLSGLLIFLNRRKH